MFRRKGGITKISTATSATEGLWQLWYLKLYKEGGEIYLIRQFVPAVYLCIPKDVMRRIADGPDVPEEAEAVIIPHEDFEEIV